MNKMTPRFSHRSAQKWLVNVAIVLGSMALAIVVFTSVTDSIPAQPALVAPAMFSWEGGETVPTADSEQPASSDRTSLVADDKVAAPAVEPRECRADRGIVNDCTFD